jgi:hypothetical protein
MWLPPEKSRQNLGDRKSKTPTSSPVGRKKKKNRKQVKFIIFQFLEAANDTTQISQSVKISWQ